MNTTYLDQIYQKAVVVKTMAWNLVLQLQEIGVVCEKNHVFVAEVVGGILVVESFQIFRIHHPRNHQNLNNYFINKSAYVSTPHTLFKSTKYEIQF